jgi:hypothetical protein
MISLAVTRKECFRMFFRKSGLLFCGCPSGLEIREFQQKKTLKIINTVKQNKKSNRFLISNAQLMQLFLRI